MNAASSLAADTNVLASLAADINAPSSLAADMNAPSSLAADCLCGGFPLRHVEALWIHLNVELKLSFLFLYFSQKKKKKILKVPAEMTREHGPSTAPPSGILTHFCFSKLVRTITDITYSPAPNLILT